MVHCQKRAEGLLQLSATDISTTIAFTETQVPNTEKLAKKLAPTANSPLILGITQNHQSFSYFIKESSFPKMYMLHRKSKALLGIVSLSWQQDGPHVANFHYLVRGLST